MNRARRTGIAAQQFEIKNNGRPSTSPSPCPLSKTARNSGFVIVLEDTSDLLRAQKAAAWREVARRIAHEIKNPLTPITLSPSASAPDGSRRVAQTDAGAASRPRMRRHHRRRSADRSRTWSTSSRSSRASRPRSRCSAISTTWLRARSPFSRAVWTASTPQVELAPGLPQVIVDPEQFKRVVVNLVDNAAEAMQDSLVQQL